MIKWILMLWSNTFHRFVLKMKVNVRNEAYQCVTLTNWFHSLRRVWSDTGSCRLVEALQPHFNSRVFPRPEVELKLNIDQLIMVNADTRTCTNTSVPNSLDVSCTLHKSCKHNLSFYAFRKNNPFDFQGHIYSKNEDINIILFKISLRCVVLVSIVSL